MDVYLRGTARGVWRRKLLCVALAVVLALGLIPALGGSGNAYAKDVSALAVNPAPGQNAPGVDWPAYRGDLGNKGFTAEPTPRTAAEVVKEWTVKLDNSSDSVTPTCPLYIDGRIYIAAAKGDYWMDPLHEATLMEFSTNGKLVRNHEFTAPAPGSSASALGVPLASYIGSGDGKIYVPLTDGTLRAVNISDFTEAWQSPVFAETGHTTDAALDIIGSIVYRDGSVYAGASTGAGNEGDFFALNAADGTLKWSYRTSAPASKGFYNAGPVFTEQGAVIIAGDDGVLVSLDTASGAVLDSENLDGAVRCELTFANGSVYAATKGGKLYKVPLNGDGRTFNKAEIATAALSGGESTSQPIVYRSKVYTFSGSMGYTGGPPDVGMFEVFDAATLQLRSSRDLGVFVNGEPLVTTAYANAASGYKVYLYVLQNSASDDLLAIEDSDAMAQPKVTSIYKPGGAYTLGSVIPGENGSLYFYIASEMDPTTYAVSASLVAVGRAQYEDGTTVTFDPAGGAASFVQKTVVAGEPYGDLPTATRAGYAFTGWYNAAGVRVVSTDVCDSLTNVTLTARWAANACKINFNANGGSAVAAIAVAYGQPYGTLPVPTRKGYTFDGWLNAAGGRVAPTDVCENLTPDITLIARWTVNIYKISFNVNGGKALTVAKRTKTATFGKTLGALPTPAYKNAKSGFLGWFTAKKGGKQVSASTKITTAAPVTYYAHWGKVYTAKFNANKGKALSKSKRSKKVTKGLKYGKLPTPARKGYTFTGWYTKKSGGSKITATTVVKISKAKTFYAHWKKK